MRLKLFVTFVLGFAAGVLMLAVALWTGGALRWPITAVAAPPNAAPPDVVAMVHTNPPPAPAPVSVPIPEPPGAAGPGIVDTVRRNPPPSAKAPVPPEAPAVNGGADRSVAGKPGLGMPIAGIDPAKLNDTFNETHGGHRHEALDIMAPRGTPVQTVVEGTVVKLFTSKEGGLTVYQFDNARELCYYYAHLDRYAQGLKEGTLLRRGDVLGYVGSTGNASEEGPHLHLAVFKLGPEKEWWKGTAIDPLPLLQGK
jgi:murein DD-endopeptidase MepM/ murein hydrolase activator NlpD